MGDCMLTRWDPPVAEFDFQGLREEPQPVVRLEVADECMAAGQKGVALQDVGVDRLDGQLVQKLRSLILVEVPSLKTY